MDILEILWIVLANLSVFNLLIYMVYFCFYLLMLILGGLFRFSNKFINFLYKRFVEDNRISLYLTYYLLVVVGITFILAMVLHKGIFANPFLGG